MAIAAASCAAGTEPGLQANWHFLPILWHPSHIRHRRLESHCAPCFPARKNAILCAALNIPEIARNMIIASTALEDPSLLQLTHVAVLPPASGGN
jgi:hypothetical protein